jgi:hypothetical protein
VLLVSIAISYDQWGRMGNRMFQYAFGAILASIKNTELIHDGLPNFNVPPSTGSLAKDLLETKQYGNNYVNVQELIETKKYKTSHTHKYIFIDEYQDINEIQEQIITRLYSSPQSQLLVTVGDDQQNIYTFRKTNIKYILEFTSNYVNSHYFYLNRNYRSQKNIIGLANIILGYNQNKLDKELIPMSEIKLSKIQVKGFTNQHEELEFFVKAIQAKIQDPESDIKLHDIVIVSRNNSSLQKIEAELAEKKIPTYYLETTQDNKVTRENIQRIKNRIILSTIPPIISIPKESGLTISFIILTSIFIAVLAAAKRGRMR